MKTFRSANPVPARYIALTLSLLSLSAFASTCPFDTGGSDAINDGVVLTRYALGITGAPLVASTRYASLDPLQVKNNIECVGCALDMNGDGQIDAVDTTIIARHLAGFKDASLTGGLVLGSGSRNTTAAVTSFLANGCAVGGSVNAFTLGGNAFGDITTPAVLGTTDGRPLIVGLGSGTGLRMAITPSEFLPGSISTTNGSANNASTGVGATVAGGGFFLPGDSPCVLAGSDSRSCGNFASGNGSTVSGGWVNLASGSAATVAGGFSNTASGPLSSVIGGTYNTASAESSFAAGTRAVADMPGAFVWADSTGSLFRTSVAWQSPGGVNTFSVRATGGVLFATSINSLGQAGSSCYMRPSGTGWICSSDRNVKERIEPITPSRVLAGVLAMPVSTWSIIGTTIRQMGPMAQDFYSAFGLGDTDKAINSIDVGGVAFAAIQGLNEKLTHELARVRTELAAKGEESAKLRALLVMIEKKLGL